MTFNGKQIDFIEDQVRSVLPGISVYFMSPTKCDTFIYVHPSEITSEELGNLAKVLGTNDMLITPDLIDGNLVVEVYGIDLDKAVPL